MKELLQFVPTARYGDGVPESAGETGIVGGARQEKTTVGKSSAGDFRGGALHLSSVLPAVSSALGTPVSTAIHADPSALQHALGFPDARSAIVVLVDGMGYWNLAQRLAHAPFMRGLMKERANQRPISTCTPSTTTAAMATFGTGTCPGLTGMLGYTQRNPETNELCQLIQFRNAMPPEQLQKEPTVFEKLAERGVPVTSVGRAKFMDSALTRAALRGARYVCAETSMQRVKASVKAAQEPGLVYHYVCDVDKVGHNDGWLTDKWIRTFENVDEELATLHRLAPKGTLIVVVADHGMVAADPELRVDIAERKELAQGVSLVAGEPRNVMLYADSGVRADDLAERWRTELGDRAWIRTKEEALAEGLYGSVREDVLDMIGDVIVCSAGEGTIVDSRTQTDKATRLPGVHGSQTRMEMDIPCLIDLV